MGGRAGEGVGAIQRKIGPIRSGSDVHPERDEMPLDQIHFLSYTLMESLGVLYEEETVKSGHKQGGAGRLLQ